jgi:hypothetical protein
MGLGLVANAAFAPRVVLLELYHADNRRRARREEGKRPSGILVSSHLAPADTILTHSMPFLTGHVRHNSSSSQYRKSSLNLTVQSERKQTG